MEVSQGGLVTTSMHPDELQRRLAHGESFTLVDARSEARYQESGRTLPGAVRIPPDELLSRQREIPKGKSLVLFADPGEQEERARALLAEGFTDVYLVDGGFDAYLRAGGPTAPLP